MKRASKIRALGTRHSFNAIADSTTEQISLQHLDQMTIDAAARTITIGAGVTYGKLGTVHRQPWLRSAQSGVSAAYFRCRRVRHGDARLGYSQPQSLQRLFRA